MKTVTISTILIRKENFYRLLMLTWVLSLLSLGIYAN